MNNRTTGILAFIFGAAAGVLATQRYFKKKYEQIAQEDIDSVKEWAVKGPELEKEDFQHVMTEILSEERAKQAKDKPGVMEYAAKLREEGYTNYSGMSAEEEKKEEVREMMEEPYVIPPEDFGEFDEYDKASLTYFADRVLVDDSDEIVDDVEEMVGCDSLGHFGEYEDDSVFVRNDKLKCDFEILLDHRNYADVYNLPPKVEE